MWNPVSSLKQYCRRDGVSRPGSRFSAGLLALTVATLATAAATPRATAAQDGAGVPIPGAAASDLARLFTPRYVPDGTYKVTVLREGLEAALGRVRLSLPAGFRLATPAGAWQVVRLDPLDAFGSAGTYDRARLAQLYWGRKVSVVRGPIERDGRVVGALTLFSPYPDPTLTRLEPGTLAILLRTGG